MPREVFKVGETVEFRHKITEFDGCKGARTLAEKGEKGKVVMIDRHNDGYYLIQHSRWTGVRVWLEAYEIKKSSNVLDRLVNETEVDDLAE